MLIDATLVFDDADLITGTRNSTDVIDITSVAADDQLGYVWINVVCNVELAGSSTPTIIVALMYHTTTSIESGTVLIQSQAWASSATVAVAAGTVLLSAQVPLELLKQYVGIRYTVANTINAGSVDAWLGLEPINEALSIQAAMPTPSPS